MNIYNDRQSNSRARRSSNAAECMRRKYEAENETETVSTIQTNECPNFAVGQCTHAEGYMTRAIGDYSHSQGIDSAAHGVASYAKGHATQARADFALTEGDRTVACGVASHAEGGLTRASADYSHSEGLTGESRGIGSHTEGIRTDADGIASHAEGFGTNAEGDVSHAQGFGTDAKGDISHAEGLVTNASGFVSHAQGIATHAKGTASSSSNLATIANNDFQTVIGKFNRASRRRNNKKRSDDAFIIGNGHPCARSNAFRVTFDGKVHTDQGGYFASPGTGYSEFFEWDDRHHPTDPVGYFVTLERDKIKIAKENSNDDFILGVVTAVPSVVGNAFENGLSNSYATDSFGRIRTNLASMNDFIETNNIVRQGMREVENDFSQRVGDQSLSSQLASRVDTTLIPSSECNMTDVAVLASTCTPSDRNCTQEESSEWAMVTLLGTVAVRDDGRSRVGDFVLPNNEGIARSTRRRRRSESREDDSNSSNNSQNLRQSRNDNNGGFRDNNVNLEWDDRCNQEDSSERFERDEEGYRVLRRIDQNTILILFR